MRRVLLGEGGSLAVARGVGQTTGVPRPLNAA
jgi:hypothetical protein